jgi:putative drug exporter of the RND superfamily
LARLLSRLGFGAHRHRLAVVLVWLVVLVGTAVGAVTLSGQTSDSFAIPGQESTTALEQIKKDFGSGGGATAQVVVQAPPGQLLTTAPNATTVTTLVRELWSVPGVVGAKNPLDPKTPGALNPQKTTAYSTVSFGVPAGGVTEDQRAAIMTALEHARSAGLTAEVTGEAIQAPPQVGGVTEGIGVIVALMILALTYGSLVMAGMNLLSAAVGVGIGALGVTIATGFLDLQSTTPILATMLGLAVGIDYALFIINRYRHELRQGADVGTAIATAVGTAGSAVLTAGVTVFIALMGLIVVGIPFLTQMGVAAAATILVAVLVALTLVPAVLSFLGRRVLPRRQRAAVGEVLDVRDRGFHRGWAKTVTKRRVFALLLSILALGVLAIPVTAMQTTLVQTPAADTTQAKAKHLLETSFGAGINGPLIVLFEGGNAVAAANQTAGALYGTEVVADIAAVAPPSRNRAGTAATLTVIPKSGPDSAATEQLVTDLRSYLDTHSSGVTTYVTGATAVSVDVATSLDEALPVYLVIVVGLALVLLVLVFRSLLVPLVGVLGFLLTIGAALGITVAVFQWGWLADAVNLDTTGPLLSLTPILMIGILFGLAMDYQIFLVARMHEAHHRGAEPQTAITTGFRQAAPVVVAAALIMFSVFAGFVPTGEGPIKSIAFALAIGIVVDAFVVRMVLVPAALALLGERAWWLPKWLRWLPALDVDGTALDRPDEREPVSSVR